MKGIKRTIRTAKKNVLGTFIKIVCEVQYYSKILKNSHPYRQNVQSAVFKWTGPCIRLVIVRLLVTTEVRPVSFIKF